MNLTSTHLRWLERRILPAVLAVNLLLMLYYLAVDYQVGLHSDSAVMNLLAQEIRDTGSLFPPSWYYANGDLWLWFTQLPIVPLLSFLPNGYAVHAISGGVTAALVLLGAWCTGAMLGQSRLARLLLLAVLASGISANMAENLYGQAAYGVLFYQACFLACSAWHMLHAQGAARWRWSALFALLLLMVSCSNPQRALAFYVMPLVLAVLVLQLAPGPAPQQRQLLRRRTLLLLALLVVALAAGIALHAHYARLTGNSGLKPAVWLGFDGMVRNTLGTLRGLLSLLGGLPAEGQLVINAKGAVAALRLMAALGLVVLLPWAVRRAFLAPLRRARLYFAVFILAAAAVNLFIALTTSLADMAAPEASVRYLVPSLMCALILLTGIAVDDARWRRPTHLAALAVLAIVGLSGVAAYRVQGVPGYFPPGGAAQYNIYQQIANHLQQQGLRYGYSGFWNAGTITVLSDHKVQLRQIAMDNGLPMPVRHLSSDRWYQAETWQGETFLMFTMDEAKAVNWAVLESYLGKPSRVFEYGGCQISVYAYNIASRMPLWDSRKPVALHFPVSEATRHHIGHLVDDGTALQSEAGEAGHLQFGPFRPTLKGNYLVRFELETSGAGVADFGVVDLAANGGATVLASQPIKAAGAHSIVLPLKLADIAGDLEFRVLSNGAGRIKLIKVDLLPDNPR